MLHTKRNLVSIERILVTGGAGFIGRRLIAALLRDYPSAHVWVIDNLHPQVHGPAPVVAAWDARVTFVHGDVADADAVQAIVAQSRPQWIYHLAAETGTGQSYDEPTRYSRVNILGTTHLVEAVRRQGGTEKIILAASRAVYGEGAYQDADGGMCCGSPRQSEPMRVGNYMVPLPAGHRGPGRPVPSAAGLPVAPASIYASSKLMQEYVLTQAGEGAPWSAVMLRFQNVYGPGQSLRNPYTGVLSIFARALIAGEELAIFEDGQIARDFVFVDDVVDALVRAGAAGTRHGDIFDIGWGEAVT
ncbi:MAG: NAD-dependent epimerase/dehydratase family protein, partial [Alphaproteobacteria bacterium]